jgi:uncharacterized protein (TIGR03382 family)
MMRRNAKGQQRTRGDTAAAVAVAVVLLLLLLLLLRRRRHIAVNPGPCCAIVDCRLSHV